MKTTHVIGLFVNSQKADKISNSLNIAGFSPESYSQHPIEENVMAINISVKDDFELQMAQNILDFYKPSKIYETDHLIVSDLKNFIHSHSKAEIYETPKIRLRASHNGINSEVHFG